MGKIALSLSQNPLILPTAVISVGDFDHANLITLAYVGKLCFKPSIIAIGVHPQRYSYHLIEELPEFVINLPRDDQMYAVDYCGTRSGRKLNKWEMLKLTKEPSSIVSVPRIKEFPFNIECKVIKQLSFGSHTSFFGEIVAIHADESLVENSKLKHGEINQLAYIAGKYFRFPKRPENDQNFSMD
ncbi:flavin reductase family protein [Candidatus Lokiarchaeum ossiferum]|uniref:flavin reductase family protein n=1 Tax=Candidatus Lokiarchaeum ossiferum TaxID=2951803 RepID=UPI00352D0909